MCPMMLLGPTGHEGKRAKKTGAGALYIAFAAFMEFSGYVAPPLATAQAGARREGLIATLVASASLVAELPRIGIG
jgi:hypothetical protein